MNITQNLPLMVQLPGAAAGERHTGVLYGSVPGQYLIAGGFQGVTFFVGDELILRTVHENQLIGFWATVVEKIEKGGTLYLLSYPEQVETVNVRKNERMNVFVPVEIQVTSGSGDGENLHLFQGALVDLSGSGCCVSAKKKLQNVSNCKLTFSLPGSSQVYILEGKVVRSQRDGGARAGVEFIKDRKNASTVGQVKSWVSSNIGFLSP